MTNADRKSSSRSLAKTAAACCLLLALTACAEEEASLNIMMGTATAGDGGARPDGGMPSMPGKGVDGGMSGGSATEVTVKNGKLQGKAVGNARVFLGIPYAKPPVGELRFKPPQPAEDWKGVKQATGFGPSCVQNASALAATGLQSEDCLSLNVFAPASEKKLPVMVWIHGGAFVAGGSNQYDGVKLATEKEVVVVTLNYRLGVLGFLSHPALEGDEHGGVPSGNDALRDQQLALKWVRDNIDKFGGDAKNVTVFGESAGAASTCIHAMAKPAKNLGDKFILQSGVCWGSFLMSPKATADTVGEEFVAAFCEGEDDVFACLREKDAKELVAWGSDRGLSGAGWNPVINPDDEVFPKHPSEIVAAKEHTKGPILLGTNKNEWQLFLMLQRTDVATVAKLNAAIDAQFAMPAGLSTAVKAHYTKDATDATAPAVFVKLMTDAVFRCPTRGLARAASAAGNKVFLYSFEHGPAFHAYEIAFVFGNPSAALGTPDVEPMRPVMQAYWSQFAKTGTPNGSDQPEWPQYDAEGDSHMTLKMPPAEGDSLAKADCDFWDSLTMMK